jgi:hypothetical protein
MGDGDNAQIKAETDQMANNLFATFQQRFMTDSVFRNAELIRMSTPQEKMKIYFERLQSPNPMTDEMLLKELAPFGDYVTNKMLQAPEPFRQAFIDEGVIAIETDPEVISCPSFSSGSVANYAAIVAALPDKEKAKEYWEKFMAEVRPRLPLPF